MKTYRYRNGAGWNRQKAVGQKMAFTLTETQRIEKYLLGLENWHDLALFSLGIDSFLRAGDLLALRVSDVTYSTGAVRSTLAKLQQKTKRGVFPELAPEVMDYVAHWIAISGKAGDDFLFTRKKTKIAKRTKRSLVPNMPGWSKGGRSGWATRQTAIPPTPFAEQSQCICIGPAKSSV